MSVTSHAHGEGTVTYPGTTAMTMGHVHSVRYLLGTHTVGLEFGGCHEPARASGFANLTDPGR